MRVLAVASEIYPLVKTGGLADVTGALPLMVPALPAVGVERETFDAAYYDRLRVMAWVETADGRPVPIGDTGRFDWMTRLNGDRKLRFVASGFGVQLLPLLFGPPSR